MVGDLIDLDGERAVVESRGGLVDVPLALVTIAKVAPPSTADELALERVIAAGWRPAETHDLGGWRLRADHGFTQRANSVLPLKQLAMPFDEALAAARDWYAERGLPLRFQLPVEARRLLEAELGERGWEHSVDIAVLAARLDQRVHDQPDGPAVDLAAEPDDAWLAIWRGGSPPAPARDLLVRHDRVVFASLHQDGRTVAVGRGTLDEGWLGITCVEVDPAHRRRGYGVAVVEALESWADDHHATHAVLEVEYGNAAALALYERLGYWHHHDYRYRTEPPRSAV